MFLLLNVLAQDGARDSADGPGEVGPRPQRVSPTGGGGAGLVPYNFRLDPWPRHRAALGKAFGCARVVFNDGLRARQQAHQAGQSYVTDAELSAQLTAAKKTPQRQWLGE